MKKKVIPITVVAACGVHTRVVNSLRRREKTGSWDPSDSNANKGRMSRQSRKAKNGKANQSATTSTGELSGNAARAGGEKPYATIRLPT